MLQAELSHRIENIRRRFELLEPRKHEFESWLGVFRHNSRNYLYDVRAFLDLHRYILHEEHGVPHADERILRTIGPVEHVLSKVERFVAINPSEHSQVLHPLDAYLLFLQGELKSTRVDGHSVSVYKTGPRSLSTRAWMNPAAITECLQILVDNAVTATRDGPRPKHPVVVTMSLKKINGNDHVVFRVKDRAAGVDESLLPKLFTTVIKRGMMEERGHGLHDLNEIVKRLHSGHAFVETHKGEGSTFGFAIPLEKRLVPRP